MKYSGLKYSPGAIAAGKWNEEPGITSIDDELTEIPASRQMPSQQEMEIWQTEYETYLQTVADEPNPIERLQALEEILEKRSVLTVRDLRDRARDNRSPRR